MSTPVKCEAQGCNNEAVGGVVTRRPQVSSMKPDDVSVTVHSELAAAPKRASKLCRTHTKVVVGQLIDVIMYDDKAMS